jgi:hypothetical protein
MSQPFMSGKANWIDFVTPVLRNAAGLPTMASL